MIQQEHFQPDLHKNFNVFGSTSTCQKSSWSINFWWDIHYVICNSNIANIDLAVYYISKWLNSSFKLHLREIKLLSVVTGARGKIFWTVNFSFWWNFKVQSTYITRIWIIIAIFPLNKLYKTVRILVICCLKRAYSKCAIRRQYQQSCFVLTLSLFKFTYAMSFVW